jgi:hypothetical protein
LGQKSIIKEKNVGWDNIVQGWERRPIDTHIFMMVDVSHISSNDKMARSQRQFQFINIFKRNWTSKTQYLPKIYGKTRNDTGTGCDFGEEEILTPSKIKVQGKPCDRN